MLSGVIWYFAVEICYRLTSLLLAISVVSIILLERVTFYACDGDSVEYMPRGATLVI